MARNEALSGRIGTARNETRFGPESNMGRISLPFQLHGPETSSLPERNHARRRESPTRNQEAAACEALRRRREATAWRRGGNGDGAAARHSAVFSPVTHRPHLPCHFLSPVLGFSGARVLAFLLDPSLGLPVRASDDEVRACGCLGVPPSLLLSLSISSLGWA